MKASSSLASRSYHSPAAYAAEATATFCLVFIGCGAIALNEVTGGRLGGLGVSLAFGLAVAGAIVAFGPISGAHMNPAITLSLWKAGRFPRKAIAIYVFAQLAGATAGAATLRLIFGSGSSLGVTVPSGASWASFALETLMTGTLVFAVLSEMDGRRPMALVAGVVVGLEAFFGGPISGASMNPARSFGPALVAGHWAYHWIYWVAPVLGGWLGVKAHQAGRRPFHKTPVPILETLEKPRRVV